MSDKDISLKELVKNPDFYICPNWQNSRLHSKEIDKKLGFKITKIEQKLLKKYRPYDIENDESSRKQHYKGTQTWIGLHPQVLQTPYIEIYHFLSFLKQFDPKTIIDLGAGYGRVGIVMNALIPESNFIGYEILEVRLNEANRMFEKLDITNCEMRNEDILKSSFILPTADIYFTYDFSSKEDLNLIMNQITERIYSEKFFIIAKGEGIRAIMKQRFPELSSGKRSIHQKEWSLYSSYIDIN